MSGPKKVCAHVFGPSAKTLLEVNDYGHWLISLTIKTPKQIRLAKNERILVIHMITKALQMKIGLTGEQVKAA